jgi:glycosyltransferase involved in cell wall biosynthesis
MSQRSDANPVNTIAALLCTYRRPDNLAKCLAGFENQTRMADEILVVVRDIDLETRAYLAARMPETLLPIKLVTVQQPGLVAARNAGVAAATADIIAMLDDDAVPHPTWLERIFNHFAANPELGGVGGRDLCFAGGKPIPPSKDQVGILLWNGKYTGNHHLGRGTARIVDTIKGANMSYRRKVFDSVRFDSRLRGTGAQPCEDLAISRAVAMSGWKLLYDPEVLVDHFEGDRDEPRHYADQLTTDRAGFANSVYNQVVATWSSMSPLRRLGSFAYYSLIGTRTAPGLVQAVRFTPSLGWISWVRFGLALRARLTAFWDLSHTAAPAQPAAIASGSSSIHHG